MEREKIAVLFNQRQTLLICRTKVWQEFTTAHRSQNVDEYMQMALKRFFQLDFPSHSPFFAVLELLSSLDSRLLNSTLRLPWFRCSYLAAVFQRVTFSLFRHILGHFGDSIRLVLFENFVINKVAHGTKSTAVHRDSEQEI